MLLWFVNVSLQSIQASESWLLTDWRVANSMHTFQVNCLPLFLHGPSTPKPPTGLGCSLLLLQHPNLQICSIDSMWIQQSNQASPLSLELPCLYFISSSGFLSKISELDAIINKAGGWTICTDLLPHEIWQIKNTQINNHVKIKELTQKNDMLHQ